MPLLVSNEELQLLGSDTAAVAERADAAIRELRRQVHTERAESDAAAAATAELASSQADIQQLRIQAIAKDGEIERLKVELHMYKCQSLELIEQRIEKQVLEKHNLMIEEQLNAKIVELANSKKENMDEEARMSAKIVELDRELSESSGSLRRSKEQISELEQRVSYMEKELCSTKDAAAANEQRLGAELSTVMKHAELHKESSEEWSKKTGELEGVVKALETHLTQVEDGYKENLEKETLSTIDLEKEADNLKQKLEKCELSLVPLSSVAPDSADLIDSAMTELVSLRSERDKAILEAEFARDRLNGFAAGLKHQDLQLKSPPPPPQPALLVDDTPGIIQSHYSQPASTSTCFSARDLSSVHMQKKLKIWNASMETLFLECYIDFLSKCKDVKMLTNKEKFSLISQMMVEKSESVYTHTQLKGKFKHLRFLYETYMSLPNKKKKSAAYWTRMQRANPQLKNVLEGEPPPHFELLKLIIEAERSNKEDDCPEKDECMENKKKMQEIECALVNLEERYMQANDTNKEKQYLIETLLNSENVLVDEAKKLRSELENTAGALSGLFSKLERKGKIEDANKTVVQHFHSQLTEDMGLLHRTVSTSVSQQENQLKSLEERMQSFVSSKGKVARGLQEHVRKLKEGFNSRIAELHGFAEQLKLKSHLSFEKINSDVTTHMSGLEDCLKGLLVDVDRLLVELQNGLCQQELNFANFFKQQHEELSRNLETSKSVSTTTVNFFRTIDAHTLELIKILEESQSAHKKELLQLQKKFEVVAADEEKYLMEKIAGLLAESNARKKNMVQDYICSLDKTVCEHSNNMHTQITKLHDFTSCMREQREAYMERAEEAFHQNVSSIERKRIFFMENLQQCKTRAESCSEQWSTAQNSVLALGRSNLEAIRSAISDGNEVNNQLHTRFSSAVAAGVEYNDVSSKSLLCSVDDSLKLDLGICDDVKSIITASKAELHELLSGHQEKTKGISGNADRSLGYDYKVDEPTCSTPRRREINIPSRQSIGQLATPALVRSCEVILGQQKPMKLAKGNGKSILETQRAPLATVN